MMLNSSGFRGVLCNVTPLVRLVTATALGSKVPDKGLFSLTVHVPDAASQVTSGSNGLHVLGVLVC